MARLKGEGSWTMSLVSSKVVGRWVRGEKAGLNVKSQKYCLWSEFDESYLLVNRNVGRKLKPIEAHLR